VVELASHFTVQQMLERDMFEKRMDENKPIYFHEFLYPLMQGYDSVVMDVDGEIGGNDQIFNMLAGRTLMKDMKNKEKFVLAMKLLADTNGVKMGKTEGNMLSFLDTAQDMFGKVMSWTDGMIVPGFELCTTVPFAEVKNIEKRLKDGENPRDIKVELGKTIVEFFFSKEEAERVAEEFFRMFKDKGVPDEMVEVCLEDGFSVLDKKILDLLGLSGSEARRLVQQGGVKLEGEKVSDVNFKVEFGDKAELVLQFGKRKFIKVKK
jgi:tyrosyl-tRNA synthetase